MDASHRTGVSTQTRQSPSSSAAALDEDRVIVGYDAGSGGLIGQCTRIRFSAAC
jgi:hypothetical protein